ncbi:MAG: DUF6918 family protein [Myxococcota bacterium]
MKTLTEVLSDATARAAFVTDGVALIQQEVAGKSGFSGMALRTGFGAVQAIRPGILADALDTLLPSFSTAVEHHVDAARQESTITAYFNTHAARVADALLSVTDARAERANNATLKRAYKGLRGQARTHTVAAIPGLGRLLQKHLG